MAIMRIPIMRILPPGCVFGGKRGNTAADEPRPYIYSIT
jgi:hypothetical protein